MTSSSEGFGVVLIEAMQNGAVPIAFNSYLSITDIIDNTKNGILVTPMDIDEYVDKLSILIDNNDLRLQLAKEGLIKSKKFSIEIIGNKWLKLFDEVKNHC